jgi:hypothetical protein
MTSPYPYPPHAAAPQKSAEENNVAWGRRTDDHLGNFKTMLEAHTTEEMDRYDQIINKINANEQRSTDRHDETHERIAHLTHSVESWMNGNGEFIEAIKRAFPKDKETGKPDYDGHRTAHLAWIEDSASSKELKGYIKKVILGAAAVALTSFATIALWAAFLKGPAG